MNKYFTNVYIELCKNKKIQNLRQYLKKGDWYIDNECHPNITYYDDVYKLNKIWLPTGDQLDDEIFNILEVWSNKEDEEDIEYSFEVSFIIGKTSAFQLTISNRDNEHVEMDVNPLVVKIKTLISLLEAK